MEQINKKHKMKASFSVSIENFEWLKELSARSGTSMSLFVESMLTGARASIEGFDEREAMSMALEQMAKGLKR